MSNVLRFIPRILSSLGLVLFVVYAPWQIDTAADMASASAAMEDSQNPLLLINTSQGDIYLELFPNEAPLNVANFLALAAGEVELIDEATGTGFKPRYFDGMRFHRVIPGFIIQAGSPHYHPLGTPDEVLTDEINADFLGLNRQSVLHPNGSFNSLLNIGDQHDFKDQILQPIYRSLNIENQSDLQTQQFEVLAEIVGVTVKQLYQLQGYQYQTAHPSRAIGRGIVALANSGPDSNGPEFFISLVRSDWLSGKYTVIGKVVEGMTTVDSIAGIAIESQSFSRASTVIYSMRRIN